MSIRRSFGFALLAVLATMPLRAQNINAAGATFPYPIYSKWFDEYHKLHPNVQINYQSIGSGGGIRQLMDKTVDFGASDGPMTDDQLKQAGFKILHFPTVLGAAVPSYNIPGVTAELKFTPEALAGIFLGKITKWNDPAIAGPNPGVKLPADDIVVVHRSDGSGTTYIWTDYLSKVSTEWESKVGRNTSVNWPVGLGGKGQRRRCWFAQADAQLHRLHRADLCHSEQNALRSGEESIRRVRQGGLGWRFRGCGWGGQNHAGRFPGLHHQCSRKGCLPDLQLYLAADSREDPGSRPSGMRSRTS